MKGRHTLTLRTDFFFTWPIKRAPSVCGGIGLLVYEDFYLKLALIIRQELPRLVKAPLCSCTSHLNQLPVSRKLFGNCCKRFRFKQSPGRTSLQTHQTSMKKMRKAGSPVMMMSSRWKKRRTTKWSQSGTAQVSVATCLLRPVCILLPNE